MTLVKRVLLISVSVVFMFLSLFMLNGNYKQSYAEHSDFFTPSLTQKSKYEVLITVITKQEMNNFVVNIDYLTENDIVIASDVQSMAHLDANQRYQFIFHINEVMSDTDYKKCSYYRYDFTYDEQINYIRINNSDAVISHNGSTTNDKSAFENALINALGENYKVILLSIAGGIIVLTVISGMVKKAKKK